MIGPQVAFIDDKVEQIRPIETAIKKMNAGTVFFDASPEVSEFPDKPIETIELVFLDLYYSNEFDPYISAQWVHSIVPPNARYTLILWSRDTYQKEALFNVLEEFELLPTYTEAWQKTDFDPNSFDFSDKIADLVGKISQEEEINQEIIIGEIIEEEESSVLINCRISSEKPVFQVRRFDRDLLANISEIKNGVFVKIVMHTKPGARLIDIFEENRNLEDYFRVPDFFEGLQDGSFFIKE